MQFGDKCRAARAKLRLTQPEFAVRFGVNIHTLQSWERVWKPRVPSGLGRHYIEGELDRILRGAGKARSAHHAKTRPQR